MTSSGGRTAGGEARSGVSQAALIRDLSEGRPDAPVVASARYLDLPRGREAGVSPAQSRYGDHPPTWRVEVRSPGPRSMLYLREKGQARCDRPADPPLLLRPKRGVSCVPAPRPVPLIRSLTCPPSPFAVFRAPVAPTRPDRDRGPDVPGCRVQRQPRRPARRRRPNATGVPPAGGDGKRAAALPSPSPAFPVTLTDDEGTDGPAHRRARQDRLPDPGRDRDPLRDRRRRPPVVGKVEDPANFPPEADKVPVVGTFAGVDVEKIVGLDTDLVIAGGNGGTQPERDRRSCASLKIPVLVVYAADVAGVYADIELTGDAVGDRAQAGATRRLDAEPGSTRSRAATRERHRSRGSSTRPATSRRSSGSPTTRSTPR